MPKIALQLYTVRDETARDFLGTLERVAEIGYEGVEFAGYGGHSPAELRRRLDTLGLGVAGCHVSIERLEGALDAEIEAAQAAGSPWLVCPYLAPERRRDENGYREVAAALESIAGRCKAAGLGLAYHNHVFEITDRVGGKPALDGLLELAPSVGLELDVCWAEVGGVSPAEYIRRYSERLPLVHLKDYRLDGEEPVTVELGRGVVDLGAVLEAAAETRAGWYVVEQDRCDRPPLESVATSLEWLRAHL